MAVEQKSWSKLFQNHNCNPVLGFFSLLRLISMVPGNLAHGDKAIMERSQKKKESSTVPTSKAQEGPGITSLQRADSSTEIQVSVGKPPVLNQQTRIIYCGLLSFLEFLGYKTVGWIHFELGSEEGLHEGIKKPPHGPE